MTGSALLVPVLVIGPAGSGRTHAVADEFARASGAGADVRVVDDVDRAADSVVDELVEMVEGGAVVVVSRRDPPPADRPALQRLDSAIARRGRVVDLGPATEDLVAIVAARRLDRAVPTDLVPVVRHLTGANLALVAAVATTWRAEGLPVDPEALDTVPASLRLTVAARWASLGSAAAALLDLLAVTGPVPDADTVGVIGVDRADLAGAHDELRSAGLVGVDGRLHPIVSIARRGDLAAGRRNQLLERTAEVQFGRGVAPATLAPLLREAGAVGDAAAASFLAAGDATVFSDPEGAEQWYDDAVLAGALESAVAVGRAEARWFGASAGAWDALGGSTLAGGALPGRHDRCTAALLAGDGRLGRAADQLLDVARRLDATDPTRPATLAGAVVALAGLGRSADAAAAMADLDRFDHPLDLHDRALRLQAHLAQSVLDPEAEIIPLAVEVAEAAERVRWRVPIVDTAASSAALACLQRHDRLAAESILERAIVAETGGPVADRRHRLLLAWVRLRSGRYDTALEIVADARFTRDLPGRDRLFRVAIEALLARRSGDVPGQLAAWRQAELLLARQGADLWSIDPWCELVVAAARTGAVARAAPVVTELRRQVEAAGDPTPLAVALQWLDLQVAVVSDDRTGAAAAASDLTERVRPGDSSSATAVLAAAARSWALVLAGGSDRVEVDAAAQGLVDLGYPWEASRLLGQAAIRSSDAGATRALLERARDLKAPTGPDAPPMGDRGGLSEREIEVAAYLLDGLTHKEIGAQLYISAKTVEHHVARIRTKLGAGSRAELLAAIRTLLGR